MSLLTNLALLEDILGRIVHVERRFQVSATLKNCEASRKYERRYNHHISAIHQPPSNCTHLTKTFQLSPINVTTADLTCKSLFSYPPKLLESCSRILG
jgi:hypothetical protein